MDEKILVVDGPGLTDLMMHVFFKEKLLSQGVTFTFEYADARKSTRWMDIIVWRRKRKFDPRRLSSVDDPYVLIGEIIEPYEMNTWAYVFTYSPKTRMGEVLESKPLEKVEM
jgi:hypothetical protein